MLDAGTVHMYSARMPLPDTSADRTPADRTRGAVSNRAGRYANHISLREDDGWAVPDAPEDVPPSRPTELFIDQTRRIISRNTSPDIPFTQSINPYKGCEHGCIYCYARPTHSYLDLSPGLDFETKIFWKPDAVARLREELAQRNYRVEPIAFGANTDPWQPVEKQLGVTRALLELLYECRHPITVVTKGSLILRDVDLLAKFAQDNLVRVMVSITTLDNRLKASLEPRAAAPATRLRAVRELAAAGVPVGVIFAPAIPFINDQEMEAVLKAARTAGADTAAWMLLRLPHEVKDLFREWLDTHYPDRAARVMAVIHDARGGSDNDPRFFHRHRGAGVFAQLLAKRFSVAANKLGYTNLKERLALDVTCFRAPSKPSAQAPSAQGDLFGF